MDVGVTLDFGVAVHPQDGESKSELMGLADKRLYELKHAGPRSRRLASSRVVPIESHVAREAAPAPPSRPRRLGCSEGRSAESASPASASAAARSGRASSAAASRQRKWERVSLAGTKAHAVLTDLGQRTARVIDLSYGGVALLLEKPEEIPDQFNAVLHVPILPPVRVILRKTYAQQLDDGRVRLGCSFVS